jgi:hypothetical protein
VGGACGERSVWGLFGKHEGNRPLERPIRLDLREIGWGMGGVEWIHLAQSRAKELVS